MYSYRPSFEKPTPNEQSTKKETILKKHLQSISYGIAIAIFAIGLITFLTTDKPRWILSLLIIPILLALSIPRSHSPFKLPNKFSELTLKDAYHCFESLKTQPLPKEDLLRLIKWSKGLLDIRHSLQYLSDKNTIVVGDLHGQYEDLYHVLNLHFHKKQIIFNGDFVDRGEYGVEIVTALMMALCVSPETIYLARGNHEDPQVNYGYGFYYECQQKYDSEVYKQFCDLFGALPYAHVVGREYFVVHGGLPPFRCSLKDIENLPRGNVNFMKDGNVPGLAENLLWSDPQQRLGHTLSIRGAGCKFGPDITRQFLKDNNLGMIIRSHEVKMDGYEYTHDNKILTIFSAGKYGNGNNRAAIASIKFDDNNRPSISINQLPIHVGLTSSDENFKILLTILIILLIVFIDYLMLILM